MEKIGKKAKKASLHLTKINIKKKNEVLKLFSKYLRVNSNLILRANKKDILNAQSKKIGESIIQRLKLDKKKIKQIINSIEQIIKYNSKFLLNQIFQTMSQNYKKTSMVTRNKKRSELTEEQK